MWMLVYNNIPEQIGDHLSISEDKIITTRPARLQIVKKCFRHRTVKLWNLLPGDIKDTTTIGPFKKKVKAWLLERREAKPGD